MSAMILFSRRLAVVIAAIVLAACNTARTSDETLSWTPEKLYADARDEITSGRYDAGIKLLETLESRYPFGRWAQQAQIDIAYAHYRAGERAQALAAIERFLKLYPNHESLDYVYYLKGLVNFNEQQGWLSKFGGQDLSERDLDAARESFDAFKLVVTRFPESKYANDAEARMKFLVNAMASGEVHIARYYFTRHAFLAAANRAQAAIRKYPQAPAIEEALYILMRSYAQLGLEEQRSDAERVLKANFPNSQLMVRGLPIENKRWWQVWR
ncbi:MAG: outer membrane protein assembly factor BamD [Quisquiliibacterium sp.]